jgi:hypothetical protein
MTVNSSFVQGIVTSEVETENGSVLIVSIQSNTTKGFINSKENVLDTFHHIFKGCGWAGMCFIGLLWFIEVLSR